VLVVSDLHPNKTTVGISANDFKPEKVQPAPYDIPYGLPQFNPVAGATRQRAVRTLTRVTDAMAMGEAVARCCCRDGGGGRKAQPRSA
jgi:hypothetical protein